MYFSVLTLHGLLLALHWCDICVGVYVCVHASCACCCRNLSLSQAVFGGVRRLEALGTVRRLPSAAAAAAVPAPAASDVLLHAVTPQAASPSARGSSSIRVPPQRETVYVHRIVPKADALLRRNGMRSLLQHLLQQLETAFRDPHVHPTSSSVVTVHVLEPLSTANSAELQRSLFEELQTLKEKEGQRLLQLNIEQVELQIHPEQTDRHSTAADASAVIRASSRGGCWLEPEHTAGIQGTDTSDCDLHTLKQQGQQRLPAEVSTADNSAAPSPLLSELNTPEDSMSREGASTGTVTAETSVRSSTSPRSANEGAQLPLPWDEKEADSSSSKSSAAAAAEAEQTAPLVPLKGVSDAQLAAKRAAAQRAGSTYIYDFLGLIRTEVMQQWRDRQQALAAAGEKRELQIPKRLMEVCSRDKHGQKGRQIHAVLLML